MYTDDYEFDYDRVIEDADELYEYADYSDEPEYEEDDEREFDCYYHNVMDELDSE